MFENVLNGFFRCKRMLGGMVFWISLVAAVRADVVLDVSLNGLSLHRTPFIDHTYQWPPKLTWKILASGKERDLHQESYSIFVDNSAHSIDRTSQSMEQILPAPAQSNAVHAISLAVMLTDSRIIRAVGNFRTALILEDSTHFDNATWIGGGTLLRRSLTDVHTKSSAVANATIFASGVGCFRLDIDGISVSDSLMDPGWHTLPTIRVPYRAFDVTSFLRASPKELRVSLGMCKFSYQDAFCIGGHAATDVCKAFRMSLRVTYTDGRQRTIVTSASDGLWKATTEANPIRYSHLYHGEQYDGRVATDDRSKWKSAVLAMFNTGSGIMRGERALGTPVLLQMPPITISKRYVPVAIQQPRPGHWVFDMGHNMAGYAELSLPRGAFVDGSPIVLKYGEVLKDDGTVDMAWCKTPCNCSSINCANQTDTYIPFLAQEGSERFKFIPSFTYHGYRYVQVENLAASYTPVPTDLVGLFLHSNVSQRGHVSFPHSPVLNGIQAAIVQTQLSNLHFHPTDCPQREKRGWTGDAQFTSRQASLNFDLTLLYEHWLWTMLDHDHAGCALHGTTPVFPQANKDICCFPKYSKFGCDYTGIPNGTFDQIQGSVADVVPYMYIGGWPGDPSWGAIATVLPYVVWKSGDSGLVEKFYDFAKANVDFFQREASGDGLIEFGYYGDWLSLEATDKPQVTSMTQIQAVSHLVDMAEYLGKHADAKAYNRTLLSLKAAYHRTYWDLSCRCYKSGSQTANLMPLILNIPPSDLETKMAAKAFVENVEKAKNATNSGLVGASFVLQALVSAGRGDIALSMAMREDEPSWGYMVKKGPGTIWETWNDQSNSHNHPMFTASIGPYLYSIVGIDPSTWSIPSHWRRLRGNGTINLNKHVTMHVTPDVHAVQILKAAHGRIETRCGPVKVAWKMEEKIFHMNATIPHNCGRARLVLHVSDKLHHQHVLSFPLCVAEMSLGTNGTEISAQWNGRRTAIDVFVTGGTWAFALGPCSCLIERGFFPIDLPVAEDYRH